nr:MAG TPA: ATP dependent DNA helicase [Caudoviricetes sp.]
MILGNDRLELGETPPKSIGRIPLNPEQEERLSILLNLIQHGEQRILLEGAAGTGKTHLLCALIGSLLRGGYRPEQIQVAAPTNKAVAVIQGKLNRHDIPIRGSTLHSLLGIRGEVDEANGSMIFKPNPHAELDWLGEARVLLVDEASMIGSELLGFLERAVGSTIPILFLGDPQQLNPVGESFSPVFRSGFSRVELTGIVRQADGNPIIRVSRNIPALETYARQGKPVELDGVVDSTRDARRIVELLAEANGDDSCKYLGWTNLQIDWMNTQVRRRLYGGYPNKLEEGETIALDAPYGDYYTNETITIEQLATTNCIYTLPKIGDVRINVYLVMPKGRGKPLTIVTREDEEKLRRIMGALREKCARGLVKWKEYYSFAEKFTRFKYNHAITVHKSQGSTYGTAIVDVRDILRNPDGKERQRLLYTAVTRPSDRLIVYMPHG